MERILIRVMIELDNTSEILSFTGLQKEQSMSLTDSLYGETCYGYIRLSHSGDDQPKNV